MRGLLVNDKIMSVKNCILFGLGRISYKHIESIESIGVKELTIIEPDKNKHNKFLKNYKGLIRVKLHTRNSDNNNHGGYSLGIIATPSGIHSESFLLMADLTNNIIIEKPVALSLSEIDYLQNFSLINHKNVTICHQNRFNKAVVRLSSSIKNQALGKLYYGVAIVRWNRSSEYYNQDTWRGTWKYDGGALMNQSIHNIDLLIWMMDSPVVEVFGYIDNKNHSTIEVEDMGFALLKFANGTFGIIESSMNTYPENFEETLSIFGEKGSVVLGGKSVNKIVHWNVKDDPIDDMEAFNEEVDNVYGNGHIALYKDFIEAMEQDREPAITIQDGRNAVEVILAIYKSSFEKRPVQLPLPSDTSTIMFEGNPIK
jgi:UDP-N-acetyl-2-amino-2-deoxyglucuronate dehydrogenase